MARIQATQGSTRGGLAPWQADLALRRLARDICTDVPAGELARLCGLSRSHFVKAFKVSVGTPPHRWLVRHRIRCAADMLEQTSESISVIALRCGFSDQSHLTRVFRTTVGASPAAWRRLRIAGIAPPLALVAVLPSSSSA